MTSKTIAALDKYFFTANQRKSLVGRTWSAKQFQRQFSRHFPFLAKVDMTDLKSRLGMIRIYNDLNKILRKRGMVMKSKDWYTSFTIIKDPGNKASYLTHKVQRISAYRNDLNAGLLAYGNNYSARLSADEVESIANEAPFIPGRVPYGR